MRRPAATSLVLVLALGALSACADYTTTGEPADATPLAEGVAESLAPEVDQLTGTSWTLTGSSAENLDLGTFGISAEFADATMSGKAPVNRYTASYTVDGDQLTLGPVATTRMAGPEDQMTAETAYLALLGTVTGFHLDGAELDLLAGDKQVLEYESADQADTAMQSTEKVAATLVGLKVAAAQKAAEDAGLTFRVVSLDGKPQAATSDLRADRINVEVEDGVITKASVG